MGGGVTKIDRSTKTFLSPKNLRPLAAFEYLFFFFCFGLRAFLSFK